MTLVSATGILNKAADIQESRAGEYDNGDKERSMEKIVDAFYIISGKRLSEIEGWAFMTILKQVRYFAAVQAGKTHNDSLIDLVSYSSLLAEAGWDNSTLPESSPPSELNPMDEYLVKTRTMLSCKAAAYEYMNNLDPDTDSKQIDAYLLDLKGLSMASTSKEIVNDPAE